MRQKEARGAMEAASWWWLQGPRIGGAAWAGRGWRKRQQQPGPGLQGPDKDACQRKAGKERRLQIPPGEKAGEAAPGPENNGYLTSVGH